VSAEIYVIGGGMHANVVIDLLLDCGYDPQAMVDLDATRGAYRGVDIIAPEAFDPAGKTFVVAIGDNGTRAQLAQNYLSQGAVFAPAVIHPSVHVSPTASVASGTVILPGAIIDASAQIGRNVIVNLGCIVGHDVTVGDNVHLSARTIFGGAAQIGAGTIVGLGATVCPKVRIGEWAIVAAGAVVVREVEDGSRVMGVPARHG
jgi:acetyltransferase EpsM